MIFNSKISTDAEISTSLGELALNVPVLSKDICEKQSLKGCNILCKILFLFSSRSLRHRFEISKEAMGARTYEFSISSRLLLPE